MIITTSEGTQIDTDKDLSPEERHVVQKLFGWKDFSDSLEQFRQKTTLTLKDGWNNSGPVQRTEMLNHIIQHLEQEVILRLSKVQ